MKDKYVICNQRANCPDGGCCHHGKPHPPQEYTAITGHTTTCEAADWCGKLVARCVPVTSKEEK